MSLRVRVVGTSGSGKSVLAARVARKLAVPHIELDAAYHQANWRPASPAQFRAALVAATAAAPQGWVVDGNYQTAVAHALDDADLVVWLDYPRPIVVFRIVRRSLVRVITRRELWNGNRETLQGLFHSRPEENIVLWAWSTHPKNRARYASAATASPAQWVRLRSPRQASEWLEALDHEAAT